MATFIDTSAIYAILDAGDASHGTAAAAWTHLAAQQERLITSNYVLVESQALIGRRLGAQAVRDFQSAFVPVLEIVWVDAALHQQAIAALLTAGSRDLSLVDCISFEVMRRLSLTTAFAFDAHFTHQGFTCIP